MKGGEAMTLRTMEVFLKVVDTGSMRAAADALYISQPSVSGAIAELEREYGVRLFERLGKKLYITPEGETLAGYARRLLALREEIDRRMGRLAEDTPLRVGASVTVGACVIGEILRFFPGPPVHVLCNNTRVIEQQLLTNQLDAALVEGRVRSRDLRAAPVFRDELMLICRADSPFAARPSVPLREIAAAPLLLRERGSDTRAELERAFDARGLRANVSWECNNTQAILNAVRGGFGAALLSPLLLRGQGADLAAVPVADADFSREFCAVVHRDKFLSPRLRAFLDACARWRPEGT